MKALLTFIIVFSYSVCSFAKFLPKAFEATFLQEKKSSISNRINQNNLAIKYQFPSNFYLKENPGEIVYICNTKKVWIYNPPMFETEKGLLREGKSNKYCYSKLFDSLSKGLVSNKLYSVKRLDKSSYRLSFLPKAKQQLGVSKLEISFKTKSHLFKNTSQLKLFYEGEKSPTVLKPQTFKVVKKFLPSIFKFVTPKNTDVIKMK
jgi:outer membrane lipoprotein-sorting protein